MKVLLLLASAVLALVISWPARAQPAGESRPAGTPSAPSAPARTGDEATANALVEQAARAYDLGQLDEALRMRARAYELSPRPSILYNQAQVLRAKNDCATALDANAQYQKTQNLALFAEAQSEYSAARNLLLGCSLAAVVPVACTPGTAK